MKGACVQTVLEHSGPGGGEDGGEGGGLGSCVEGGGGGLGNEERK